MNNKMQFLKKRKLKIQKLKKNFNKKQMKYQIKQKKPKIIIKLYKIK